MEQNRVVWSIFGPSGSGKTYLWQHLLDETPAPRFVIDRRDSLSDLGAVVESAEHLRKCLIAVERGDLPRAVNDTWVIEWANVVNGKALFDLARSCRLPGTYIADEVYHWYPQAGARDDNLHEILMEGRQDGQSLIATSRQPQNVGKNLVNESALTAFGMSAQTAAKRVAQYLPRRVTPQKIMNLGQYEHVYAGRTEMLPHDPPQADGDRVAVCRLDPGTGEIRRVDEI